MAVALERVPQSALERALTVAAAAVTEEHMLALAVSDQRRANGRLQVVDQAVVSTHCPVQETIPRRHQQLFSVGVWFHCRRRGLLDVALRRRVWRQRAGFQAENAVRRVDLALLAIEDFACFSDLLAAARHLNHRAQPRHALALLAPSQPCLLSRDPGTRCRLV